MSLFKGGCSGQSAGRTSSAWSFCVGFLVLLSLAGCGSGKETAGEGTGATLTKEYLYHRGHILYAQEQYDTAAVLLKSAYALDSMFVDPVRDLAMVYYEMGRREPPKSVSSDRNFRVAHRYFGRLEELGNHDAETYDRLCEISLSLDDDRSFLRYARKNAELYPYERQYYNLGLAQYGVGDYQNVIKTQKEAIEKFKTSQYIGGYYRLLGLAYVKVDRDQTAERTFNAGLKAVDAKLAELRRTSSAESDEYRRLADDRVNILLQLKRIFLIYKKQQDLERVDRQLKEAGYEK